MSKETEVEKRSTFPGFYQRSVAERVALIGEFAGLSAAERATLEDSLAIEVADSLIENVIGRFTLPLGVAVNFLVNGREVVVPMAVEEPSIVAACSFAAKLARPAGGFQAHTDAPVMIGQIQLLDVPDIDQAVAAIQAAEPALLAAANQLHHTIVRLGGGAKAIEVRVLPETAVGPMLIVHILLDTRDAMGANAINTTCEALAPQIEALTGGRAHLRILSNLADHRLAHATATWPVAALATAGYSGAEVAKGVVEAWAFAAADPYRAATHNKGVMNGIDAVAVATGNDWRGIEAGAHAYAARNGRYTSLTTFGLDQGGNLVGQLSLPLAVGVVGGTTKAHPTAQVALKILGVESAAGLAEIMAAVGLAQNFAALRALATEGIQRGHMALHARQVALAAGATGLQVAQIAQQLVAERAVRVERARELVAALGTEATG